jgi:adenosylhomocysteine nucleosidase
VIIAATGFGMTNAAAATQHMIDTYEPQGIIFTGIAGAIDPDLKIGDVVIPDRWVTHDYGLWSSSGFQTDTVFVGRPDTAGFDRYLEIPVDTNLHRRLVEAADIVDFHFRKAQGLLPDYHAGGVGVSGNAFIASKSKREQLHRDLGALIVDMESAAVVQTAHAAGIPVAVVRGTSDLAGGGTQSAEDELRANFRAAAHNAATVVKQFLEGPALE